MGTYRKVKNLNAEDFKRLSGVHLETFNQMVEIVKKASSSRQKTGRPPKLRIEDQVLMTLEYLREYRTYFHVGAGELMSLQRIELFKKLKIF